mgnify:CR=1 FL=1
MAKTTATIDGNTAATHAAYAYSEVAAIYPITPSSPMGENADAWAAEGRKNIFGHPLDVIEMQSEGGASGSVHGALSAGALTTTFTASQGLMLMIPNMHKIAGEMLPTVFHVSARSLACQSLSIFGDHSDVMAVRNTGFALVAAASIQEVMDLGIVSHLSTLKSQVPFLNFFDGFRTSHEVQKVEMVGLETMKELFEPEYLERFRSRGLRPEQPTVKVGAQNPDVYFQGRETINLYYDVVPEIVQEYMDKVAKAVGRQYNIVDYVGAPDAEKVIVAMGSACDTIEEAVNHLVARGEKVGAIKVRLYRPFPMDAFLEAMPESVKKIAVLDRTKEPGSLGEPLYLDVTTTMRGRDAMVIGGRYGLSSKEFTPSHVKAVYDHLDGDAFHGFTVGIEDDVSFKSIPVNEEVHSEPEDVVSCMFWGLGSDGTVGANKNSIKIIGDHTDMYAQGYFVYDSKKSGGITISHLRFGKSPIQSPYLITKPGFVACHNPAYIGRYDMLSGIKEGGVFLLNSEWDSDEVFEHLTEDMQKIIIDRNIRFYNIDALQIATDVGLGNRINTVMQAAFFKISGVLPEDEAIQLIKDAIKKTFISKGEDIVKMNWECVDRTSEALQEVDVPDSLPGKAFQPPTLIPEDADPFAKEVIEPLMYLKGDDLPVSKMSYDGVIPTGTTCLEKRGIAPRIPRWLPENCIQCNQCVMACPHAVIRAKQIAPADLRGAPASFDTLDSKTKNDRDLKYRIQVYAEDCTGCGVCIETCPAKTKALELSPLDTEREAGQRENAEFFEDLPDNVLDGVSRDTLKGSQFLKPLFEFSGACAGCGETPYVKLATQLFGDRMVIANATGCSSIYGGTFPTVPYCKTKEGRGPSWGNSLFEDNAEYGFGMRLAVDSNRAQLRAAVDAVLEAGTTDALGNALKTAVQRWDDKGEEAIQAQNAVREALPAALAQSNDANRESLLKLQELQDYFVDKSVWILGGDGWAYDIGYGGLDHVVAAGRDVNVLILDTEVYSNTGGQASKATPLGAVAKFAQAGKRAGKKNLGLMFMTYGNVYVASIAMGANRNQTLKAFIEAEQYDGPSVIMAYSPCIAHGIDMRESQLEEKRAVECGYFPLYRYNPMLAADGKSPLVWESKEPKGDFIEFLRGERRYTTLGKTAPESMEALFEEAHKDAQRRNELFRKMAEIM